MELLESLTRYGLKEKEAKTYLANLALGSATATDIALKSDLSRTLTYDLLERLIDQGLVTYAVKHNKKYFTAADPEELVRLLQEKERTITEVMTELQSLQKIRGAKRPKVEIYEGIEGTKTLMNRILGSGAKEFYAYGSSKASVRVMPAFIKDWHKRRVKLGIKGYVIYNEIKEAKKLMAKEKEGKMLYEWRYLPIDAESPTATLIFQDMIALVSWTNDPFAVTIQSEVMAENHKQYFKEMWNIAKKP